MILRYAFLSFLAALISLKADLIAHYALDEIDTDSSIVLDSLENNHGTLIGAAPPAKAVPAPHGTGYNFPLRSGFQIAPAPEVQPDDQFTITWWFRPTTLSPFDRLYETMAGTGNNGAGIRIDLGGTGFRLRALLRDGNGSTNTVIEHPLNLRSGDWYFFSLRYDSLGERCSLTILGESDTAISATAITEATTTLTTLGTGLLSHNKGVFIAANDANAANANDFGGAMDDIAFFQTGDDFGVLSDSDLAQVYNIGALAFDPPAPRPVIDSFSADAADYASGDTVTLTWNVTGADTVTLSPAIGPVDPVSGSTSFTASFTELYTLTATNAEGPTTANVQVTVDGLDLSPLLNEFVANNSSFDDGNGDSSDWIEIYNRNTTPLDISGYHLTDDATNLTKWTFPAGTVLAAQGYLVVFASENDTPDAAGNLHTNFSLRADGEYLALVAPGGSSIIQDFAPLYPPQKVDTSYSADGFRSLPTPGAMNEGEPQAGFVEDTTFDIDRGHYSEPFAVNITSDTTDAQIYYTTDGTAPTPENGTLFETSVPISTTTVLRAAAFKENFIPTNVDTQSYLFLDDVLTQPNAPPNTTNRWAGRLADYEMDQQIVQDPDYADDLLPALQKFPTLSITIDPDDFYGDRGIYQNPLSEGSLWERPVSAELISHDGSEPGFQINAGLRIQGGSSRNPDTPKHSFSLRFRNRYGAGKLRYPLFRNSPDGRAAVEKFDTLQLRSNYNFGFSHRHFWQCDKAQYNRDQFSNDLFLAMGHTGVHGRWTHLYINGIYWGLYHLHERPDQDFMAAYFGGSDDDYDAVNAGRAQFGTSTAYREMASISRGNITSTAVYETLQQHLDLDSFIDYMILNFYVGNTDWDNNNWRAVGTGPTGVPFHFFPWDTEFAISQPRAPTAPLSQALTINRTTVNNRNDRPTGIHQDLTQNADYRQRFGDRVHALLFNDGPLSPQRATEIWQRRSDEMDLAIIAESARWGDFRRDVEAAGGWQRSDYDLYTKNDHYLPAQSFIIGSYFPQRPGVLLSQLRSQNLYPDLDAPTYQMIGNTLTITNPNPGGTIFYTFDGSDPQGPNALTYTGPITLTESATYKSRIVENGEWSALQSQDLIVGTLASALNLVISEIYYNEPGQGETNEFIEFTNISAAPIDLSHVTFTAGLTYTFPLGTTLAPGAHLTLGPADYQGNLDNGGETLTLVDADGVVIESFRYEDSAPWPTAADGEGFTLTRISPASQLDPALPSSWRPSVNLGGTPGSQDATSFTGGDLLSYTLQGRSLGISGDQLLVPRNLAADDVVQLVETSTNLINWITVTSPINESVPVDGFTEQAYSLTPTSAKRFFRLRAILRE